MPVAEVRLEREPALLEELRKMLRLPVALEGRSALGRSRVVRVVSVIETLTQLCKNHENGTSEAHDNIPTNYAPGLLRTS